MSVLDGDRVPSLTQRGLRWVAVSLGLALAASLVALASILAIRFGPTTFAAVFPIVSFLWEALVFGCAVPAILGFSRLRLGRDEFGPSRRAYFRRGTVAFGIGGTACTLLALTGLVLGWFYVPAGAYVSGAVYSTPWEVFAGETIRAVHILMPPVIAVFLGLFLLETVWPLARRSLRLVALISLVSGVSVPLVSVPPVAGAVYDALGSASIVLSLPPMASLAIWIAVVLLVERRLPAATPDALPGASGTPAVSSSSPGGPPLQPATP